MLRQIIYRKKRGSIISILNVNQILVLLFMRHVLRYCQAMLQVVLDLIVESKICLESDLDG